MHDRDNPGGSSRQAPEEHTGGARDPLRGTPYRYIRTLSNSGAMGQVVEAEQVALHKRVVVKLLRRELAESDGYIDRMRLEAEALGVISPHPHVVSVLDLGRTPDGRAYLVMEKLVGRTLGAELAARGFIPVDEAVALGRQLLAGLAAAHGVGVVHRDIKPDNLFLCDPVRGERVLKILDFGIAKVVGEQTATGRPAPLAQPTAQGLMVGTPRFCAPEQAVGLPLDHRADIYAAGAVLYSLVTGRDPFHHHRVLFNLLRAQVNEVPPPPSKGASQPIPEEMERAIMKALQKRPEDRWATAVAFSEELERVLRPAPQRWLTTEPIDVRSFRARVPETPPPAASELPRDASTLQLPLAGAAPPSAVEAATRVAGAGALPMVVPPPHQAAEPTPFAASPLEARDHAGRHRTVLRDLMVSWRVAALFALMGCVALAAALAHLVGAR